jgi:hypothetical protein
MRLHLTKLEIEALHAATGNIHPCMFTEEWPDQKQGEKLFDAWNTGREKLAKALEGA